MDIWSKDVFIGPEISYAEPAQTVKTYCSECGHETGEERVHAADCPCLGCQFARKMAPDFPSLVGKSLQFRRMEGIR